MIRAHIVDLTNLFELVDSWLPFIVSTRSKYTQKVDERNFTYLFLFLRDQPRRTVELSQKLRILAISESLHIVFEGLKLLNLTKNSQKISKISLFKNLRRYCCRQNFTCS